MNKLMLSTLPESESAGSIFHAIGCEEGRVLEDNEEYDDSHEPNCKKAVCSNAFLHTRAMKLLL
jgi:hypothetical protein